MFEKKNIQNFNETIIKKTFNQYKIKLIPKFDSIIISIYKIDTYNIFQSTFNLEYLQSFQFVNSNSTIHEIIQLFSSLIDTKNIKIEEYKINMKLLLFSNFPNFNNIELILNQKNILSKEIIEIIIEELQNLTKEKKLITENFQNEILKLNNKIELISKENNDQKIQNKKLKEEIIENEIKITEMEKKIKILEQFHIKKDKIQNSNLNLKKINSIRAHDNIINSISIFPSGNIISVSSDQSIKIFENNTLNLLQHIENAHNNSIVYTSVKDENNFVTCSSDKNIKTWIKKNNIFELNKIIENAHEDKIWKVIYYNNIIISCSDDKTIKLWDENLQNNYYNKTTIKQNDKILSMLLLNDINFLVSGGVDGILFYNLYNFELIFTIKETLCGSWNAICRINKDQIIIKGKGVTYLKIISISQKQIIYQIDHQFYCWGINLIKDKGIFLVGGNSKDFKVYRNDNYECIQTVDSEDFFILGFIELKNGNIVSYGHNGIINVWSF